MSNNPHQQKRKEEGCVDIRWPYRRAARQQWSGNRQPAWIRCRSRCNRSAWLGWIACRFSTQPPVTCKQKPTSQQQSKQIDQLMCKEMSGLGNNYASIKTMVVSGIARSSTAPEAGPGWSDGLQLCKHATHVNQYESQTACSNTPHKET